MAGTYLPFSIGITMAGVTGHFMLWYLKSGQRHRLRRTDNLTCMAFPGFEPRCSVWEKVDIPYDSKFFTLIWFFLEYFRFKISIRTDFRFALNWEFNACWFAMSEFQKRSFTLKWLLHSFWINRRTLSSTGEYPQRHTSKSPESRVHISTIVYVLWANSYPEPGQ